MPGATGPTGALQAISNGLILDQAQRMKGTLSDKDIAFLHQGALTISFVNRYRCKDGTYRWIEWRSRPASTNSAIRRA